MLRTSSRFYLSAAFATLLNLGPGCSCGGTTGRTTTGGTATATTGHTTGSGTATTGHASSGTSGSTATTGSGTATNGGSTGATGGCGLVTCQSMNANCGPIGDGCGDIIQCGSCDAGSCGGGGVSSQCGGQTLCTPKTCADFTASCGQVGDGCGHLITCGGCDAGGTCGGGGVPFQCGGTLADGGHVGDGGCTKLTCADFDAGCGEIGDGCGGTVMCGSGCMLPDTCGGGGVSFQCGAPPDGGCQPLDCAMLSATCGYIGDGCGTAIQCGGCDGGDICGGGGIANQCGGAITDGGVPCTGLCLLQLACDGGGQVPTTLTGTVFAATNSANGFGNPDPIPGATVYIPNGPIADFPRVATCDICGVPISGEPIATTTSMEDGGFVLTNVPVPAQSDGGIPLVVQLGRWRREVTIPASQITACQATTLTANETRLPRNHNEGNIPLIAMVTGNVDSTECVLRKMGIDDAEFTAPGVDAGRVQLWVGNGAGDPQGVNAAELTLTSDLTALQNYDQVIFACTGSENGQPPSPDQPQVQVQQNQSNIIDYTTAGGRIYGTHYSYVWLENDPGAMNPLPGPVPFSGTADWDLNAGTWNSTCGDNNSGPLACPVNIDTSFPKGQLLADWLQIVGTSTTNGVIPSLDYPRWDFDDVVVPPSENWLQWPGNVNGRGRSADPLEPYTPLHYTFNTPVDGGTQCGRVVFSDFHVENNNGSGGQTFPGECGGNSPLNANERVLEFMLFDLASCVVQGGGPQCAPLNCIQQGFTCGQQGDGCGNLINCGGCDAGGTCGGDGVGGNCGGVSCNPFDCAYYHATCGDVGDGCNNVINCGYCDAGGTCGGAGVPNQCGSGVVCTPETCTELGLQCGPAGNGCGGSLDCGGCDAGTCGGGGMNGVCGSPNCHKETCTSLGYTCGAAGDGCGGIIQCGNCDAGVCGGSGIANQCGTGFK